MRRTALASVLILAATPPTPTPAQTPDDAEPEHSARADAARDRPETPAIDPAGQRGALLIAGGGSLPKAVRQRFVDLAGGAAANIVVVPTASAAADDPTRRAASADGWRRDFPDVRFSILHTRDRTEADREDFTAPLREATGVWFGGGVQERLAEAYVGTRFERELLALLARGGVIGGTSAGAAIQSRTMIQEARGDQPVIARGLDLLRHAIVDQHFLRRERLPRLRNALLSRPGHFGLGVDEGTAAEIRGRTVRAVGASKVVLLLAAANGRDETRTDLEDGATVDLVSWQRAARRRAEPAWPDPLRTPHVAAGTLVLVGGGRIPGAAVDAFVAAAGGANARIVLVPSAMPEPDDDDPIAAMCRERGVAAIATLHCTHPEQLTPDRLRVLAEATGVWFGGGRQWRLVDAFEGTPAPAAFANVLARGGAIGGTSAGATIQGEFLVRGNPLGNAEIWCEGYDRGFAFLPGVAVDQHFVRRDRVDDLRRLVAHVPQLVGLGIDEGTAAIVRGSVLEVIGDSRLAVFDRRSAREGPAEPVWLQPGERWDLAASRRLSR